MTRWLENIATPTHLADLGILPEQFNALAVHAQALAGIWRMREYSEEQIRTILETSHPDG